MRMVKNSNMIEQGILYVHVGDACRMMQLEYALRHFDNA